MSTDTHKTSTPRTRDADAKADSTRSAAEPKPLFPGRLDDYRDVVVDATCVCIIAERALTKLSRESDDALAANPPSWFASMRTLSTLMFPHIIAQLSSRLHAACTEHAAALRAVSAVGWLGSIDNANVKKLRDSFDALHNCHAGAEKRSTNRGIVTWGSELLTAREGNAAHQIHAILASTLPGAPFIGGGSSPPVVPFTLTSSNAATLGQFALPAVARDAPLFSDQSGFVSTRKRRGPPMPPISHV